MKLSMKKICCACLSAILTVSVFVPCAFAEKIEQESIENVAAMNEIKTEEKSTTTKVTTTKSTTTKSTTTKSTTTKATTTKPTTTKPPVKKVSTVLGDANLDGEVNSKDARLTLRFSAQLEKLNDDQIKNADYDKSGDISAKDARYILRVGAHLDPFAKPTPVITFKDNVLLRKYPLQQSNLFNAKTARTACVYDYDKDIMLYAKNMNDPVIPASTTKLMTAYLGCKYLKPDDVLTVGNEQGYRDWNTSTSGLEQGDRMKFKDMLKCLLVPSGCDAAYTIAVAVARKEQGYNMSAKNALDRFVVMMNNMAQKLGMNDSHFVCPDGFPSANHYVSAHDMIILAVNCYQFDLIRDITSKPYVDCWYANGDYFGYLENSNELLHSDWARYYKYCTGMKTGSCNDHALQNLVTVAEKDGRTFFAVVFEEPGKDARYNDLVSLFNTAFNYFWRK